MLCPVLFVKRPLQVHAVTQCLVHNRVLAWNQAAFGFVPAHVPKVAPSNHVSFVSSSYPFPLPYSTHADFLFNLQMTSHFFRSV